MRQEFMGAIKQRPPMFSALKIGGERLYAKARRGEVRFLRTHLLQIVFISFTVILPTDRSLHDHKHAGQAEEHQLRICRVSVTQDSWSAGNPAAGCCRISEGCLACNQFEAKR